MSALENVNLMYPSTQSVLYCPSLPIPLHFPLAINPLALYRPSTPSVHLWREKVSFISMENLQHGSSFSSPRAYLQALSQIPYRLARRACSVSTSYEEMSRVRCRSGSHMAKTLRWPDLVGLGLGGMVGAGVFVATGHAARVYAGPAVVVSYAIAGLCALLSAFCYTEFAVDMPVAGGAFSYLRVTFGELSTDIFWAPFISWYS